MKLLHFADLHLDAPFAWLEPDAARRRRQHRRDTLTRILALAEAESVDAVLCAGDLFEHDRVQPDTIAFLQASFARSTRPIYLAPGNHDWYGPQSPYAVTAWSPNVHVFTEAALRPVALEAGVTLWGAAHRAPANTDGFFAGFRVDQPGIHLAVAHASERSWLDAQESGKTPHAPFDAAEIAAAGLSHAFLGHFHLPKDAERHTYPGNPDPLEFGEVGERGAVLATVGDDGRVTRERRPVAVSQVHDVEISVDGCEHADDIRDRVSAVLGGLRGSVRVTLTGTVAPAVRVDGADLVSLAAHLEGLVIRRERVTVGYDLPAIAEEATVRGQFLRTALDIEDPERRRQVILLGLRAFEERADLEVL
ncbi:MAG TPA: metallophosphoesterase [Candidatus Limnocylindria bacterium]|jgi:DNA repair exonuclease SbcCD nuclease subunit